MAFGLAAAPTAFAAAPANADAGSPWALGYLKYSQVKALSTGSGVTVGLIDDGVQPIPDIAGQLVPGADFTGMSDTTSVGNGEVNMDAEGHGNGMASTIAGQGQPVQGLAPQAKIMPIRNMLASHEPGGLNSSASSIQYAIDHHVQVINISQGWIDGPSERTAIAAAVNAGIVVVVSAGNDGNSISDDPAPAPADNPGVVDVTAIDQNGKFAGFSNYGPQVAVAAPGVSILNDQGYKNDTTLASGTSPAAAYVSATAALIFSEHPTWTAGQVIRDLISTADPAAGQTPGQHDDRYGYGIIDPLKALQAAAPTETTNPLLTAAATATPSASDSATAPDSSTDAAAPVSSSSSSALLIALGALAVLAASVVTIVLIRRGKNTGGKGGTGDSSSGGASGPPPGPADANRTYQQAQYPPQQQYPPQ